VAQSKAPGMLVPGILKLSLLPLASFSLLGTAGAGFEEER